MNPGGRSCGPSLFLALALLAAHGASGRAAAVRGAECEENDTGSRFPIVKFLRKTTPGVVFQLREFRHGLPSASRVLAWQAAPGPPQDPIARVVFAGRPVPGAVVIAARGEERIVTASDADGFVRIPRLEAGAWNVLVEMTGFETLALADSGPADRTRGDLGSAAPAHSASPATGGLIGHVRFPTARQARHCGGGATGRFVCRRRIPGEWQRQQRSGLAVCTATRLRQQPAAACSTLFGPRRLRRWRLAARCATVLVQRTAVGRTGLHRSSSAGGDRRTSETLVSRPQRSAVFRRVSGQHAPDSDDRITARACSPRKGRGLLAYARRGRRGGSAHRSPHWRSVSGCSNSRRSDRS